MSNLNQLFNTLDKAMNDLNNVSQDLKIDSMLYDSKIDPPISPIEKALNLICESIEKEKKNERTNN